MERGNASIVAVIDDDQDVGAVLGRLLETMGYQVETYCSGMDFLSVAHLDRLACLVVDQVLPGISGIDALEVLRERQVGLPAIVITSSPDARLRARTRLADACLIEKPLLNDLLTRAIRSLLSPSAGPARASAKA